MIAALALGSAAALLWASAGLLSAPASRLAGPALAFAWTSASGVAMALPVALVTGFPSADAGDWALVGVAGLAYAAGTGLWMLGVQGGRVSIVVPIVACDGAIAALLAAFAGASLPHAVWLGLAGMVAAIVLITASGDHDQSEELAFTAGPQRPMATTVLIALIAAVLFGVVFFASGKVSSMEPIWVVALVRCVQVIIAVPVCLSIGRFTPPRGAWRYILGYGFVDAAAYVLYVTAAGHDLAVASVAASQYAALAAVGAVLVFRERLLPAQILGVGALLISVVFVAAQG